MPREQRVVRVPLYLLLVGIALTVLSPILAVVASTRISGGALAESEQRWCQLIATLDDAYRETPPATAAGLNVARGIADLRRDLNCGG